MPRITREDYYYVYSERSHRTFYCKISVPEEIGPSKMNARMNNGILVVKLPKKDGSHRIQRRSNKGRGKVND